jgi:hypothetical protein
MLEPWSTMSPMVTAMMNEKATTNAQLRVRCDSTVSLLFGRSDQALIPDRQ